MTTSQQELEFKLIRCPNCEAVLFAITPAPNTFSIRVKCRRCSDKRRVDVYLIVAFSLEPAVTPVIDSKPENFASA
jgi:hypothetical protein